MDVGECRYTFYFHFLLNSLVGLPLSSIFGVEYSFEYLNEYSSTPLNRKFCRKYVYVMITSTRLVQISKQKHCYLSVPAAFSARYHV